MSFTVNLGLVKAIYSGLTPPTNIKMIWYDEVVKQHKYYDTVSSAWRSFALLAKRGTLTLLDGVNYSWDTDNNLIINHALGAEDIYVIVKDNTKTFKSFIPYKTLDSNNVIVYIGERITGEFCVICF
jgi:hypothetical protein